MNQDLATGQQQAGEASPAQPDDRLRRLRLWVSSCLEQPVRRISPASEDASFRRYFRVETAAETFIVMDAPPDKEDCRPFLDVTERLLAVGVNAPRVHRRNLDEGFLLLSDLGSTTYLANLDAASAEALYADAFSALLRIQRADATGLPPYDHALLWREMMLFKDWFVERRLGITLHARQEAALLAAFEMLAAAALAQPLCFVHRDYHSRNLMVVPDGNPGVLDYQDAVHGPITYDLLSLLRDAYVAWPRERVETWVRDYSRRAQLCELWPRVGSETVLRWFDLMGAQRYLKIIGIFSRLWLRDGKARYLDDIPRVIGYLMDSIGRYPEMHPLYTLLQDLNINRQIP